MIENTADRDPMLHLLGALGGMDEFIGGMERQGQREVVRSEQLPTKVLHGTDEDFLKMGFTFGEADPSDPLFRPATLPEGWKREGSDHAMWSYILDTNGRRRASIFYKAAFYDRKAHLSPTTPLADLSALLWGEITELPVDDWTPVALWVELLTGEHDRLLTEAKERDSYYPEGAQESRKQADVCATHLAKMREVSS